MANLQVRDAANNVKYLSMSGAGTDGDPMVPVQSVAASAIVPGTGATNLGKAEDAAHTSADVGVMALAVRKDSVAALAGTDGDYIPLTTDANGRLYVQNRSEIKTLTWLTSTTATAGDNAIIAAPGASTRIVVSSFVLQNETTTANTLILKDGATAKFRTLVQNQGDGIARTFPPGYELRLTADTALNLNLSSATTVGYNVAYFTEAT